MPGQRKRDYGIVRELGGGKERETFEKAPRSERSEDEPLRSKTPFPGHPSSSFKTFYFGDEGVRRAFRLAVIPGESLIGIRVKRQTPFPATGLPEMGFVCGYIESLSTLRLSIPARVSEMGNPSQIRTNRTPRWGFQRGGTPFGRRRHIRPYSATSTSASFTAFFFFAGLGGALSKWKLSVVFPGFPGEPALAALLRSVFTPALVGALA